MLILDHDRAIILFDENCRLCSAVVSLIIHRDKKSYFRFAALQSKAAKMVLANPDVRKKKNEPVNSVMLLNSHGMYFKTDAVLQIFRNLPGLWPALYVFRVVPRKVRDQIYNWVAKNRYRWFGKQNQPNSLRENYPDCFL